MNKLKQELEQDPLGRGYSAMTDAEVAASLAKKDRSIFQPISSAELLAWAGGGADNVSGTASRYERIKNAAANHESPVVRGAALSAVTMISRDGTNLDLSKSDRQVMLEVLVAGKVITADEKAELYEMATAIVSRAEELGLGEVYAGHVMKARAK